MKNSRTTRLLFLSLHDGHTRNNLKLTSSVPDLQRRSTSPTSQGAPVAIFFDLDLLQGFVRSSVVTDGKIPYAGAGVLQVSI
ncbi:hypothetical protein GQ55_1G339000 [Panicum hallii var. hallii]|uniref:Uncharacterized protein n=1 Tax=Panicum hallii var. hallii TaxID=1504633 RepID=A0A2T7FAC7_9POAL|nr:hypothetical protein GQ55_1G339000 [Panicum hallii var. hallii]